MTGNRRIKRDKKLEGANRTESGEQREFGGLQVPRLLILVIIFAVPLSLAFSCVHVPAPHTAPPMREDLGDLESAIMSATADPARFPDDPIVLATLKEALKGAKERNGGIGACLVREATGEILEVGHNSQYEPYFRSDLHAEMHLLDRWEEKVKRTRSRNPTDPTFRDPRDMGGIVLYTSVEPCPMCMGRIINAGVKKVRYAVVDEDGGMATRFDSLPPFWKGMAGDLTIEPARCSPALTALAKRLFRPFGGRAISRSTLEK
jgi:tRNA(adenine34) deaminase